MEQEMPEAVLLYGDTNSCLAVISAKRRKIPVFHMEAGNLDKLDSSTRVIVTGVQHVPEIF